MKVDTKYMKTTENTDRLRTDMQGILKLYETNPLIFPQAADCMAEKIQDLTLKKLVHFCNPGPTIAKIPPAFT